MDIGAGDVLKRYERWRRFDALTLVAVTDGLNRLFSNDVAPIRLARIRGLCLAAELPGHRLHSVADAGHREAAFEPLLRRGGLTLHRGPPLTAGTDGRSRVAGGTNVFRVV